MKQKKHGDLLNVKIPVSLSQRGLDYINETLEKKAKEKGKQSRLAAELFDFIEQQSVDERSRLTLTYDFALTPEQVERYRTNEDMIKNLLLALISNEVPHQVGLINSTSTVEPTRSVKEKEITSEIPPVNTKQKQPIVDQEKQKKFASNFLKFKPPGK